MSSAVAYAVPRGGLEAWMLHFAEQGIDFDGPATRFGEAMIALRDPDGSERTVPLRQGDVYVVPRGTEHRPSSTGGAILMFEPTGTLSTGDRHEGDVPGHVDSTTGHQL